MVLAELGGSITRALKRMSDSTVVDDAVFAACLNDITRALLQADVRFASVKDLQANVKAAVNLAALPPGANKRHVIHQAVVAELCRMLDPGTPPPFSPAKGKPSIVMLVGLQGSGKTTTCAKYAAHQLKKGFSPALVCADTFRAGAFDQLKQNAAKAGIPFYGSYAETDPVKVAVDGVETFRNQKQHDLIIVDTSGRHKQEAALFEEMRQVAEAVHPDLVILVMDASIGQAAFDQARAFKQSVPVGAVIITKMDGHAKGGGALSAVAATKAPVIFIGTGEHIGEFEPFNPKPFVSRLLGMGDLSGLMDKIKDALPGGGDENQNPEELVQKFMGGGAFTLRMLYEMFQSILNMGPLGQLFSMLPGGFGAEIIAKGRDKEGKAKVKRFMAIMDSMTAAELDTTDPNKMMNESRIKRIARGSGRQMNDVKEMLEEHKRMAKIMKKMPKVGNIMNRRCDSSSLNKIIGALPQNVLKQLGGASALQNIMKQAK